MILILNLATLTFQYNRLIRFSDLSYGSIGLTSIRQLIRGGNGRKLRRFGVSTLFAEMGRMEFIYI